MQSTAILFFKTIIKLKKDVYTLPVNFELWPFRFVTFHEILSNFSSFVFVFFSVHFHLCGLYFF